MLANEVGFENEGFILIIGDDGFNSCNSRDHMFFSRIKGGVITEIAADAVPQNLGFADIQNITLAVFELIDSRLR